MSLLERYTESMNTQLEELLFLDRKTYKRNTISVEYAINLNFNVYISGKGIPSKTLIPTPTIHISNKGSSNNNEYVCMTSYSRFRETLYHSVRDALASLVRDSYSTYITEYITSNIFNSYLDKWKKTLSNKDIKLKFSATPEELIQPEFTLPYNIVIAINPNREIEYKVVNKYKVFDSDNNTICTLRVSNENPPFNKIPEKESYYRKYALIEDYKLRGICNKYNISKNDYLKIIKFGDSNEVRINKNELVSFIKTIKNNTVKRLLKEKEENEKDNPIIVLRDSIDNYNNESIYKLMDQELKSTELDINSIINENDYLVNSDSPISSFVNAL